MAIKTDYVDGDILNARDLNEAFQAISALLNIVNGTTTFASINGKDIKSGQNTIINAGDIPYLSTASYPVGSLGDILKNAVINSNGKVTVLTSTTLNAITQHGVFYLDHITGTCPDASTKAYMSVLKTGSDFFVQILYTKLGGVFVRTYTNSVFGEWKNMQGGSGSGVNIDVQNALDRINAKITSIERALAAADISIPIAIIITDNYMTIEENVTAPVNGYETIPQENVTVNNDGYLVDA